MAQKGGGNGPSDLQNVIEVILWLLFAGGAYWMTIDFDRKLPTYELGPAFWPRILILGIAIAAISVLAGTYMKRLQRKVNGGEPAAADETSGVEVEEATGPVTAKVLTVIGLPLLYVFLIHRCGFYLVTPFFLAGYMYLLGVRQWTRLTTITVGLYLVLVVIFVRLIFTPLPQGLGVFHSINGQLLSLIQ